ATAARAPPITAAHETADCEPGFSSAATIAGPAVSAMRAIANASLMPEKHQEDDDRDRYAEQPKKNCRHFSFLRVLVVNSPMGKSFRVALPEQPSRRRLSATNHDILWRLASEYCGASKMLQRGIVAEVARSKFDFEGRG
ncbi:MAG: hypothetical protein WB509_25720, partial [Acetobacteraceae bacterium]